MLAKIERVTSDEDGLSVKLTTSGINTKGAYARKYVEESLDEMKSGEYNVIFQPWWSSMSPGLHPSLLPLGVEVK